MKSPTTIEEIQIFWIIGALDRLSILGFIHEPPYKTSSESVDLFIEIDERIDYILTDDELKDTGRAVIKCTSPTELSDDVIDGLIYLLLQYKNNREEMVKYSLNSQFAN